MTISRKEAVDLLNQYIKNERMRNHCYASEAVMRGLAKRLGEDEEKWGIAGLLHDLDIELVEGNLQQHTQETEKILVGKDVDAEIIDAIKRHNEEVWGSKRESIFHHALAAGETITGLIVATALVYPDKKVASVKKKSVVKRMKEKAFAASVNRDTIMECQALGLTLDEFTDICLHAMTEIADQLGL